MRAVKVILLAVVGLLVLADFSWRIWVWNSESSYRAQFKFGYFYTNGVACVGIEEAKTGKPLLINWDFGDGEKPGEVSYFFHGTNILDVYLKKDKPPRYRFIFHGPDKSEVWWMNIGGEPSFSERVSYDTNGNRSNFEVWYAETWHSVDRRNDTNGIVINGQWFRLKKDANGMWTTEMKTNQ
ncbi:MAG: hypothetical protein NTZ16_07105 [Verrucomicrobia bacterium]|nr:hypothetical protein [Verrucomicrobiota bacterium]